MFCREGIVTYIRKTASGAFGLIKFSNEKGPATRSFNPWDLRGDYTPDLGDQVSVEYETKRPRDIYPVVSPEGQRHLQKSLFFAKVWHRFFR